MTPRTGLKVALIGLAITVICGLGMAAVVLLANGNPDAGYESIGLVTFGIGIFLVLGMTAGHVVIVVGLVMAAVGTLTKRSGKPSSSADTLLKVGGK